MMHLMGDFVTSYEVQSLLFPSSLGSTPYNFYGRECTRGANATDNQKFLVHKYLALGLSSCFTFRKPAIASLEISWSSYTDKKPFITTTAVPPSHNSRILTFPPSSSSAAATVSTEMSLFLPISTPCVISNLAPCLDSARVR